MYRLIISEYAVNRRHFGVFCAVDGNKKACKLLIYRFFIFDNVRCGEHGDKTFNWPVTLPEDIKWPTIKTGTFNHLYRPIALPKKGSMGETAVF